MNQKKIISEALFLLYALIGYACFVAFIVIVGQEEINMTNILKALPIGLLVIYIFRIILMIMRSIK